MADPNEHALALGGRTAWRELRRCLKTLQDPPGSDGVSGCALAIGRVRTTLGLARLLRDRRRFRRADDTLRPVAAALEDLADAQAQRAHLQTALTEMGMDEGTPLGRYRKHLKRLVRHDRRLIVRQVADLDLEPIRRSVKSLDELDPLSRVAVATLFQEGVHALRTALEGPWPEATVDAQTVARLVRVRARDLRDTSIVLADARPDPLGEDWTAALADLTEAAEALHTVVSLIVELETMDSERPPDAPPHAWPLPSVERPTDPDLAAALAHLAAARAGHLARLTALVDTVTALAAPLESWIADPSAASEAEPS